MLANKNPILCYVTDRRSLPTGSPRIPEEALLEKIATSAQAGVDWIQIREKDLSSQRLASLVREALWRVTENADSGVRKVRVLVNDRLDIAVAERAGGVHLGENSVPPGEAKRLLRERGQAIESPREFLVGVSCHSLEAAKSAAEAGADYLFFGPVFSTPSKAAFGPPQGLPGLAKVCGRVAIPVFAIGGVTGKNAGECFRVGAAGIAAIRLFQEAQKLTTLVESLHSLHR